MEITKRYIAEQVLRVFYGGEIPADTKLDIREIASLVGQARDKIFRLSLYENMQLEGEYEILPEWLTAFRNVELVYDEDYALWYFALPAQPIAITRNMGVWSVNFMGDPFNEFIPLQNGRAGMNNPAYKSLEGKYGYYIETFGKDEDTFSRRAYLTKPVAQADLGKTLLVKMAASHSAFDIDDPLPMTPSIQHDIITLVLKERPFDRKPTDTLNDNIDG